MTEQIIRPSEDDVYCNIIDWYSENVGDDEDKRFIIRFFGRTNTGLSITVSVYDFFPYFFVKVPKTWTSTDLQKFINGLKGMSKDHGANILDYSIQAWKEFYGFKADQKFSFLMIRFKTSDSMKYFHNRSKDGIMEIRMNFKSEKFQLYESNFDPMLRFMHIQDIKSCGWIKLPKGKYRSDKSMKTFTDYHLRIKYEDVVSQNNFGPDDPKLGLAKFKLCSYDLECYSHDEQFPQPDRKEDPIIQIGMVFYTFGETEMTKYILTLKDCDDIDDANVLSFENEKDLLLEFQKIIQEEDPDIMTGYNIYGFDEKYIYGRKKINRIDEFGFLSRMGSRTEFREDVKLSSAALGDNVMSFYHTIGRVKIDLMKLIQKDYKLNSYKLDAVAEHFMREIIKKVEISGDKTKIYLKKKGEFKVGNYVKISEEDDIISEKLKIIDMTDEYLEIRGNLSFILDNETITKNMKQHRYFYAGSVKDDLSAREMFAFYAAGDSKDICTIAKYCIQDCVLPIKLLLKLNKIPENMEMASISSVPMQWIFLRGQGIKSFSLVVKKCRKRGYLIKTLPRIHKDIDDDEPSFEGAIVLTPEPKFHRVPISVNDYSSLYPSSMIAENISHEMFVDDPKFEDLPNYTYNIIKFDQERADGTKEEVVCKYAKEKDKFGVIPEILNDLLTERKQVRKLEEVETDVFMKAIYNGRQLALKLTANSLYGQIGAGTSPVCYVKLAASTTAVGRSQIMIAKNFVENDLKNILLYIYENKDNKEKLHEFFTEKLKNKAGKTLADDEKETTKIVKQVVEILDKYTINPGVVYGDSVANYTPILYRELIKINKSKEYVIRISTIEELGYNKEWKQCTTLSKDNVLVSGLSDGTDSTKEYCELTDVESWTDDGWKKVERIIRHKLASHKKMMRVLTHCGLVDVTDDHSLITNEYKEVSPKDLKVGDTLLHWKYPDAPEIKEFKKSEKYARIAGFFMGDGSCGIYDCPSGQKSSWALNNATMERLELYKTYCEFEYPMFDWKINNTIDSSGVYKLVPISKEYGDLKKFIKNYRDMMYVDKRKHIPDWVFNGSDKIKQAFWQGLYDADGDKNYNNVRVDQKNQASSAQIAYLAHLLGYKISLNTRFDKPLITRVTCTMKVQRKRTDDIKKIHEIAYPEGEYVYDLTTENHHFQAGVGQMIVHNTDSIFNNFGIGNRETGEILHSKEILMPAIVLGNMVSKFVQAKLRFPHELSYEKTFFPFAIFSKKRYVGNKYTDDDVEFTQTSMGIVLKRRDNAQIVKKVIGGMVDIMMNEIDCDKTIIFTKKSIRDIFKGKYPIKDFVTSKTIKDINKYKTTVKKDAKGNPILIGGEEQNIINIAHVMLAQKMIREKRANAPQTNDRVPFAYIEMPKIRGHKLLQGEKIEHPDYIIENNLKIDYMFYITNQIMLPAIQFLELVTAKPEDATELFNDLIKEEECKRAGKPYMKNVSLDRWLV